MSMMFHSPQVHGFFAMPTDPLSARPVFRDHLASCDLTDHIVVAPDMGSAKSAARFAKSLSLPIAAGNKERVSDTHVKISGLVGNQVRGHKHALIYDDEIATGGSIHELSRVLVEEGVEDIIVVCTHGVFTRGGLERLAEVPQISEIITTDTVYIPPEKRHLKLKVLSVASVFADAIRHNLQHESISELFVFGE
jgi:ribose-phosphate pyrophosphokinase